MFSDILNGSHKALEPGYFEWWYFHFLTEEGTTINIVLHETDIFGQTHEPYISLSLLFRGQKPLYYRCRLCGDNIVKQSDYLKVGGGFLQETTQTLSFSLKFPGLKFNGEITKLSYPLSIENGLIYEDEIKDRKNYWVIQIPHALFEGCLQVGDVLHRLQGSAYQDHNWGNIQMQAFVSDWVWGHFSNNSLSIIFYRILTQGGSLIDRAAVVTETSAIVGTTLNTGYLELLSKQTALDQISSTTGLYLLSNPQAHLFLSVHHDNLMRSRVAEDHDYFLTNYCRWSCQAQCDFNDLSQDINGITEYLRIRRKSNG